MENEELTKLIIACAFEVHHRLGAGFLEKVYENALKIELSKHGLMVKQQHPINVYYDDSIVGEYFADLFVNDLIVVELKAVKTLTVDHEVQLVNYLSAINVDIGLLINFGSSVRVKRKHRKFQNQNISRFLENERWRTTPSSC